MKYPGSLAWEGGSCDWCGTEVSSHTCSMIRFRPSLTATDDCCRGAHGFISRSGEVAIKIATEAKAATAFSNGITFRREGLLEKIFLIEVPVVLLDQAAIPVLLWSSSIFSRQPGTAIAEYRSSGDVVVVE